MRKLSFKPSLGEGPQSVEIDGQETMRPYVIVRYKAGNTASINLHVSPAEAIAWGEALIEEARSAAP